MSDEGKHLFERHVLRQRLLRFHLCGERLAGAVHGEQNGAFLFPDGQYSWGDAVLFRAVHGVRNSLVSKKAICL